MVAIAWRRAWLVVWRIVELIVATMLVVAALAHLLMFTVVVSSIAALVTLLAIALPWRVVAGTNPDLFVAAPPLAVGFALLGGGWWLWENWEHRPRPGRLLAEYWDGLVGDWQAAAAGGLRSRMAASGHRWAGSPQHRADPIEAKRAWSVAFEDQDEHDPVGLPHLRSLSQGGRWESAKLVAECAVGHHRAPDPNCHCGIYAVKEQVALPGYAQQGIWVAGPVALTGRVVEAELGYRAERVRIVGPLTLHRSSGQRWETLRTIAVRLELRYGVEVNVKGEVREPWTNHDGVGGRRDPGG